jgi:hypothetical protein
MAEIHNRATDGEVHIADVKTEVGTAVTSGSGISSLHPDELRALWT